MHLFVVSSQVCIQWVRHTWGSLEWIISMHPAELWLQSSLVDFQSSRIKTKKTSSFPTPLHPYLYPWILPPFFLSFFHQIWHVYFIIALLMFCLLLIATFYWHSLVYFTPIFVYFHCYKCVCASLTWIHLQPLIWSPDIPPTPRNFPFSLLQSTCDTLRSHSDSLGFAPNVLPSHPAIGNFEEFACWWRRRRDPEGTV